MACHKTVKVPLYAAMCCVRPYTHTEYTYKLTTHTVEWQHFSTATVLSFIYASKLHLYVQHVNINDITSSTVRRVLHASITSYDLSGGQATTL